MMIVSEIGSNHKGILPLACEYIRQAALTGCDFVKFQLGHDKDDPVRGAPNEWLPDLVHCASEYGVGLFASCFTIESLHVLKRYSHIAKIASRYAFANHSEEPYEEVVLQATRAFDKVFVSDNIKMEGVANIYCQAKYPTMPWEVKIPERFDEWTGYSSHTPGIEDALVAVSRGATYIEKHITLDKTESSIKDNHFALSIEEMATMVKLSKGISRMIRGIR